MKNFLFFFFSLMFLSSCMVSERVIIPEYVTVEKLISLQNGMSKKEVAKRMEVDPFDAYHGIESGCELYSYKYVVKNQKIRPQDIDKKTGLRRNREHYTDAKDIYVYFKNDRLVDLITDLGTSFGTELDDFGDKLESFCLGPVNGCTDVKALNYNEKASKDDESCRYCPCDYIKNPNYDPVRNCGKECIPIEKNIKEEEEDCNICDVIKNASPNTTINVTTIAPWETNSGKKSNSTFAKEQQANKIQNAQAKARTQKRIDKVKKALEKSKLKDKKKGKKSAKTKVLEKTLRGLVKTRDK